VIAAVVGIGALLLVRLLLSFDEDAGSGSGLWTRLRTAALVAIGVSLALGAATIVFKDSAVIRLSSVPVEPIALVVTLALVPVAAVIVTARDAHRFVIGALAAIGFWFVAWYPNISALPLPSNLHNAFQGLLPTYVYPFQFPVSTLQRGTGTDFGNALFPALGGIITLVALVVGYSAWTWRIALAERRREDGQWASGEAPSG